MIMLSATSMNVILFLLLSVQIFKKIHKENAKVAFRLSLVTLTTVSCR